MKKTVYAVLGLLIFCGGAFAGKVHAQGDKAAVLALEAKWDTAAVKGDIAAFDAMYADTFVFTDPQGKVQTKAEALSELRSGDIKYLTSKGDEMKVSLYGDAAVVTGKWTGKFVQKGKTLDTVEHYTSMYVRQNGQWRCVATHTTTIK